MDTTRTYEYVDRRLSELAAALVLKGGAGFTVDSLGKQPIREVMTSAFRNGVDLRVFAFGKDMSCALPDK